MFSIKIDDVEIGNFLKITNVDRGGLAPVENTVRTYGKVSGSRLLGKKYNQRPITIEYSIYEEVDEKWELIKKILTKNDVFKIVFGDYPDRYFLATTEGETTFEKHTGRYASGVISLVAHYPFALSLEQKEATREANKLIFKNDGTAEAFPLFKFTAERAYKMIGFSHANGEIAQFGYENNERPVMLTGQTFIFDTKTKRAYVDGKIIYINEGRGFSVRPGETVEIGLILPDAINQVVHGYMRSEYL